MKRGEKNRELRARCVEYLVMAGSMPLAQRRAKEEGFSANTSVWISAMGEILSKRTKG